MTCKEGTNIIIEQIIDLIGKLAPENYSKSLNLFNGSSLGQHFRHIFDFYQCLIGGSIEGRIDYAKRERDLRIETEPDFAIQIFRDIGAKIETLEVEKSIDVLADFSADLNEERPVVHSSLARELMYAYDHAVHHLAMIKMGLKAVSPQVCLDENMGVAPSTIKHWNSSKRETATRTE